MALVCEEEMIKFMTIFFIRRQKNMQLNIHFLRLNYLPLWDGVFANGIANLPTLLQRWLQQVDSTD